ncbi:MAG: HemK/PrmC family methyltransferase [Patulibacter sp.]
MNASPTPSDMHARAIVARWVPQLVAAGIGTARLDAELLVAHVLGIARERILIDDPQLSAAQLQETDDLLRKRAEERVPVAYLVGQRWFADLSLNVSPSVLVPRPETELLVDLAAEHAPAGARLRDVGTGSGAIALALAKRRPDLTIVASDIDGAALDVARENARRHGVLDDTDEEHGNTQGADAGDAGRAKARDQHVGAADAQGTEAADGGGQWPPPGRIVFEHAPLLGPSWAGDVVVSNPPYVESTLRGRLAPELDHEPAHALYAGEDGLDVIRDLIDACRSRTVGLVLIEHGATQGTAVREMLAAAGYPTAATEQDLAGLDRVTWARHGT